MKHILTLLFLITITGCTFATIPVELRESSNKSDNYCYPYSENKTSSKVNAYLENCYTSMSTTTAAPIGGLFIPIGISVDFEIHKDIIKNGTRYSVKTSHGYSFTTEITESEHCGSELQMYAMNSLWAENFKLINQSILNDKIVCRDN